MKGVQCSLYKLRFFLNEGNPYKAMKGTESNLYKTRRRAESSLYKTVRGIETTLYKIMIST